MLFIIPPLHNKVGGGLLVSLRLSIHPAYHVCYVAHFIDYIHLWHKYNPWGDDMLHTISRSVGQMSRSHFIRIFAVGAGCILVDHRFTILVLFKSLQLIEDKY